MGKDMVWGMGKGMKKQKNIIFLIF